jgi:hypothetical protein
MTKSMLPGDKAGIRGGWPTSSFGVDPSSGYTVAAYARFLNKQGMSLSNVIESLRGPPSSFRAFEEARVFARSLEFKTFTAYMLWARTSDRPYDIPAAPHEAYRNQWKGWGDWLGTGRALKMRWTRDLVVECVLAYFKKHRHWPKSTSGLIARYGCTWSSPEAWLRRTEGSSLPQIIEELGGIPARTVGRWNLESIRSAASAYIEKHKRCPSRSSTDTTGLPLGGTWRNALCWARDHGFSAEDVYGKRLFNSKELLAYLRTASIINYDIRTGGGYKKAYTLGLLDRRCPSYDRCINSPGWKWPHTQDCCGENSHNVKLSWKSVDQIRELHRLGWDRRSLARRFGVSSVNEILRGETWKIENHP